MQQIKINSYLSAIVFVAILLVTVVALPSENSSNTFVSLFKVLLLFLDHFLVASIQINWVW